MTVLPGPPDPLPGHPRPPGRGEHDLSSLRVAVTGAADIPVELVRRVDDELPFSARRHRLRADRGWHGGGDLARTTTSRPSPPRSGDRGRASRCASSTPGTGTRRRRARRDPAAGRAASCPTTSTTRRPRRRRSRRTDGCGPATSARSTTSGLLRIVGRSKDMFIVGGFNAYPAEIENYLLRHPAMRQAAVVGMPDDRLGEVGMAFVVLRAGLRRHRPRASSDGAGARWPTTRCPGWWSSSTSCR